MPGSKEVHDVAREWIEKAENDLKNATHTLVLGQECPTDTVCFHAQQCVEKYIKALLTLSKIAFPKSHDITRLLALLPPRLRPELKPEEQVLLNEYATGARYPGWDPISLREARFAVVFADSRARFSPKMSSKDKNDDHGFRKIPGQSKGGLDMTDRPQMVQCPHCKKEFPLTEALSRQLEEKIRSQVNADLEKRERDLDSKATDLTKKQQELEQQSQSLQQQVADQVQAQLKAEREKISKEAHERAKSDLGVELEAARSQAADRKAKLEEAQKRELALLKEKQELQDKQQELQLETARKLAAERKTIADKAVAGFQEEQRLKDRQNEDLIAGMKKTIDELRRKAEQGSQQVQGEALEVEFENVLRNRFRDDEISPVAKGVRGADILQKVYDTSTHEYCGAILWETKQARNWSDGWIEKLKGDQREAEADLAVILSTSLPKGVTHFDQVDGIWVTDFSSAPGLATLFRQALIQLHQTRNATVNKNERMEVLYQYLSGPRFRQKLEAVIDAFTRMQEELNREKRAVISWWSKREREIEMVINSTAGLYGDLHGILGASLPPIEKLELPAASEVTDESVAAITAESSANRKSRKKRSFQLGGP